MKNWKIRKKLLLGFGTVLFLLLIAALVSFLNMRTMETQISNYTVYTVPNNNMVWQMRRDMISVQRYLLMALTEESSTQGKEYLATAKTEAQRVRTTLTEYLKTTRADKAKVEQLQNNVEKMGPYREQIASLLSMDTELDDSNAYGIFINEYKPILDESADILLGLGEFQNERADQQATDARDAFASAILLLILVIVIAMLITVVITVLLTRSILIPVRQVQEASLAVARGNLDVHIDYDGKDELGDLATNMGHTMQMLKAIIGDVDMLLESMSHGDFTCETGCAERYVGDYSNILKATKTINDNLSDALWRIHESSEQVSSGSEQVSNGAQALSQGATEQASSVEELSATIFEISGQIRKNADNAQAAKVQVERAGSEVGDSNRRMQEMIAAMNDISGKSSEISKIIKTIEDIAFQTNILALNAAVEAARAGTAGTGFAVVADEVRNLAGKSAEAAKSTTRLIEETVSAVNSGTRIADETAQAMQGVVGVTQEMADRINEIASASIEQASSIAQITMGIEQISSVVQTNSATAEESAAASEELSGQAQMLKDLVVRFRLHKRDA